MRSVMGRFDGVLSEAVRVAKASPLAFDKTVRRQVRFGRTSLPSAGPGPRPDDVIVQKLGFQPLGPDDRFRIRPIGKRCRPTIRCQEQTNAASATSRGRAEPRARPIGVSASDAVGVLRVRRRAPARDGDGRGGWPCRSRCPTGYRASRHPQACHFPPCPA